MFARRAAMLLTSAERAMSDGLYEEALAIASADDLKGHRQVEQLLGRLAELLLRRGQERLLSKRFDEALADFDRAGRCGHESAKVSEWRERAHKAMEDEMRLAGNQKEALAVAKERLGAGSLAGARDALGRAPIDDPDAQSLSRAITGQAERSAAALAAAKSAFNEEDFASAVRHFKTARSLHGKLEGLAEFESDLVDEIVKRVRDAMAGGGGLALARRLHGLLEDVGRSRPGRIELDEALKLAESAARCLGEDRYAKAGVLLGRLAQLVPDIAWIKSAREHLEGLEKSRRALLEGPLGMLCGLSTSRAGDEPALNGTITAVPRPAAPREAPPLRADDGLIPRRLLLRIDGVGSFLLLRGDRVGIGRAGSRTADLELVSDLSERHAEIIRAGEDYFVVSMGGVDLAGRQVEHALLQDGDRIRLGKRVRLTFRRPSLKSNSAALDLGEGVRTTGDCRRVILWGGPLLLGNTRECHVQLAERTGGMILMERDGQVVLRPMGFGGEVTPIFLGQVAGIGSMRLSLMAWSDGSGTGRVIG